MSSNVSIPPAQASGDPTAAVSNQRKMLSQWLKGDIGQLPVLIALVLMAVYFNIDSGGVFLKPRNLSNLTLEIASTFMVALASVLVLLLGEIDLSLAAVANLCGAVMVTFSVFHHWSPIASILAGLVIGLIIGVINGVIVAIIRVPSFIVTLAALLGYQGVLLHVLLPNTTIRLTDTGLTGIANGYLPDWLGISLPILAFVAYAALTLYERLGRQRHNLTVPSWGVTGLNIGLVGLGVLASLYVFESYLGVPYIALILVSILTFFWLLLRFTTFGRHVYAVGGNAEASRRAGINVVGIRIAIFALASMLAAVAGVLESSRTISASAQVSPTLLLEAIAAAVIGGVSLFGGRGSVWGVVIGSLIIGGLINGLTLQGRTSDIQYMVEGIVLLLAVVVDALIRRRNAVTGR